MHARAVAYMGVLLHALVCVMHGGDVSHARLAHAPRCRLVFLIEIFVSRIHSAYLSLVHALDLSLMHALDLSLIHAPHLSLIMVHLPHLCLRLRQLFLTFLHLDILCRVQRSCTRLTWLCFTCFTSDQERIGYSDYRGVSSVTRIHLSFLLQSI